MPQAVTHQQNEEYWQAQDWRMPDTELARTTGATGNAVRYWRRRLNKPLARRAEEYWRGQDWTLQNCAIARTTGLTACNVGY